MIAKLLRAGLLSAAVFAAGCTESTLDMAGGASAQLPEKLVKEPKNPRYLQTVRGVGYMLAPD